MNVSLTPELERFVRNSVATGLYNNSSEVVREALRLLFAQRAAQAKPDMARPDKDVVRSAILNIKAELMAGGVTSVSLFGSVARGDANAHSDVDLVIDVKPRKKFNLLDLAGIQDRIARAVGRKVDVVVRAALVPAMRKKVLKEAERIF